MNSKDSTGWQDKEALRRFQMIAPLLEDGLDVAKKQQMREEIALKNEISMRTIYRYESAYKNGEFNGLRPADRKSGFSKRLPENYEEILNQAIQLKREVPKRSVQTIIDILELEERIAPGSIKRSTLERHLYKAGFGVKQMQMYNDARKSSSKRFCKPHRMMLVQADIKYGPKIGKKKTYLATVLDDHSRFPLHSEFYDCQEEWIVADAYHKAISKFGVFLACYQDNGSQYSAHQLKLSLTRLGIHVKSAPVASGKSKGKVEKFHQVVDAFLTEVKLKNLKTLDDLNYYWKIYLEEKYTKDPHGGIAEYYESLGSPVPEGGITPLQEFNRDTQPLKFLDASVVSEAFLYHETRKVDKGACISFNGKKYETKPALIGATVEISYDPFKKDVINVSYPGMETFTATPVKIGSYCDKNPTLPTAMQPLEPTTSRLLDALEKKNKESLENFKSAISYTSLLKDGENNV